MKHLLKGVCYVVLLLESLFIGSALKQTMDLPVATRSIAREFRSSSICSKWYASNAQDVNVSWSKGGVAIDLNSFSQRIAPIREVVEASVEASHSMARRHALALKADPARAKLPGNYYSRKFGSIDYNNSPKKLGLWGPPEFQRKLSEWRKAMCNAKETNQVTSVHGMDRLPFVEDRGLLVQRSLSMSHVGHTTDIECPVFPHNGRVLEEPYCDLRRCNQRRFPFIYIVIGHRNRPDNLVRIVQSMRNSTEQCENPPEWAHCTCVYVSDYGTNVNVSVSSKLREAWNGHVRLITRKSVTEAFSRGSIYNSALRYIPTPANRSLLYLMDADLVMTDSSAIDRALVNTCLGKSVTFPILRGTTSKVQGLDTLFNHLIDGTIWKRSHSTNRVDAYGTAIFYFYDNPFGYCGPYASRTIHGKEDVGMYGQFKELEQSGDIRNLRMHEPHLWHIYHTKATDWQKSTDGMNH
eukprot:gb/GECG01016429.1/.p1 GENE.gb/GECG01016429.1/~~gb/GECG01016429.1/.p1  ORF type:complete len:466 (+),score=27.11 gb/GECG01016429.1/:1-1398(+)